MATGGRDVTSQSRTDQERAAFESCFQRYYRLVLAFARRRVEGREDSEDVAAEAFAVAWRRRSDMPTEPLPWLYRIATNVINNHRRSRGRRRRLFGRISGQPATFAPDPAESLAEHDIALAAFTRLSEPQREVLRLAVWEGLTPDQAAVVLDCSPVAYRVRLHRARAELAKHLGAAGHVQVEPPNQSSAAAPAPETK